MVCWWWSKILITVQIFVLVLFCSWTSSVLVLVLVLLHNYVSAEHLKCFSRSFSSLCADKASHQSDQCGWKHEGKKGAENSWLDQTTFPPVSAPHSCCVAATGSREGQIWLHTGSIQCTNNNDRGETLKMSAPLSVNVLISVHLDREEAKRTRLSPSLLCSLLQADSIIGRVFIYAYIKYIHNFSFKFNLIFLVFSLQFYCLTWTSEMKHVSVQAQPLYPQCTSVSLLPLHTQRLQRCVSTC